MEPLEKRLEPAPPTVRASDPAGQDVVDAAREDRFVPPAHRPLVDSFRQQVLDAPDPRPERGAREASLASGQSQGKKVYRTSDPDATPARWLVRPYFERVLRGLEHVAGAAPLSGWAEMTYQHVAHAAGEGARVQRSHVVRGDTPTPLLVTRLEPFHQPVHDLPGHEAARRRTPARAEAARRGVLLDFLAGHPDRHADNLLLGPGHDHLAIDNALTYRYARPQDPAGRARAGGPAEPYDTAWPYHADAAWDLLHPAGGSWDAPVEQRRAAAGEEYRPTLAWWSKVREPVHRAMEQRVALLRDPKERDRILSNFRARSAVLDDASAGRAPLWTRHVRMW